MNFNLNIKKVNKRVQTKSLTAVNNILIKNVLNSNKKLEQVKKNRIIPLHIFQTWHTLDLPTDMKNCVENLKYKNPEFRHYLYDDNMCRDFIKQNFNNDVLYAYNKLKPGAYKSDLWRYCILYKKGGIYVDIKYSCINGFKLLSLTDKEYFVADRPFPIEKGVYNALISALPNSEIMLKCIETIVYNVSNNLYNNTCLAITGPHVFLQFNPSQININSLEYIFKGETIAMRSNNLEILKQYKNYRNEQQTHANTKYYADMWNERDVYNYKILKHIYQVDLSSKTIKTYKNKSIKLFSGTPGIVEISNSKYLVVMRWINYYFKNSSNVEYSTYIKEPYYVSFNSFFMMDGSFNKIGDDIFIEEPETPDNWPGYGLEDIRLFNYNNTIYYTSSYYDCERNVTSTVSGNVVLNNKYELNRTIILPNMYDLNLIKCMEKNWSMFNYKNKLAVIYKWFPLQIGEINYTNNNLNIIEIKYNIPSYFKDARGSTPGFIYNHEIWFLIHKTVNRTNNTRIYYHFLAVFDINMNLLRYTDLFKFSSEPIEFCCGLIIKNEQIILSYSLMDTKSLISVYDLEWIETELKWFKYNMLAC